MDGNLWWIEY